MISGFDLLETIPYKGKEHTEEVQYSIELPPIFKVFVESFKWKESVVAHTSFYLIPYLKGGEIYLQKWNYKELFSTSYHFEEDELEEKGFVLIATSNRGIYLGTKGDNKDKIFSTKSSLENNSVVIANNIFLGFK